LLRDDGRAERWEGRKMGLFFEDMMYEREAKATLG
jgi:hypothetical protein